MDIKNFLLKTKKNYKQIIYSSFNDEDRFFDYVANQLENGFDIIELKEDKIPTKQFLSIARKTRELCSIYNALFFIYDRCDIAFLCEADGIILSEKSVSLENAKNILGEEYIYGYEIENENAIPQNYDFVVSANTINASDIVETYFIRK